MLHKTPPRKGRGFPICLRVHRSWNDPKLVPEALDGGYRPHLPSRAGVQPPNPNHPNRQLGEPEHKKHAQKQPPTQQIWQKFTFSVEYLLPPCVSVRFSRLFPGMSRNVPPPVRPAAGAWAPRSRAWPRRCRACPAAPAEQRSPRTRPASPGGRCEGPAPGSRPPIRGGFSLSDGKVKLSGENGGWFSGENGGGGWFSGEKWACKMYVSFGCCSPFLLDGFKGTPITWVCQSSSDLFLYTHGCVNSFRTCSYIHMGVSFLFGLVP